MAYLPVKLVPGLCLHSAGRKPKREFEDVREYLDNDAIIRFMARSGMDVFNLGGLACGLDDNRKNNRLAQAAGAYGVAGESHIRIAGVRTDSDVVGILPRYLFFSSLGYLGTHDFS